MKKYKIIITSLLLCIFILLIHIYNLHTTAFQSNVFRSAIDYKISYKSLEGTGIVNNMGPYDYIINDRLCFDEKKPENIKFLDLKNAVDGKGNKYAVNTRPLNQADLDKERQYYANRWFVGLNIIPLRAANFEALHCFELELLN